TIPTTVAPCTLPLVTSGVSLRSLNPLTSNSLSLQYGVSTTALPENAPTFTSGAKTAGGGGGTRTGLAGGRTSRAWTSASTAFFGAKCCSGIFNSSFGARRGALTLGVAKTNGTRITGGFACAGDRGANRGRTNGGGLIST